MSIRRDTYTLHHLGHPPRVGPFARYGWDELNGRWVVATTAAGHALVNDFLAAYPVPLLSLRKRAPGLFRVLQSLRRVNTTSDEHAEALYGVAVAATTFDTAAGVTFDTHAVWQIYSRVSTFRQKLRERADGTTLSLSNAPNKMSNRHGDGYDDYDPPARPEVDYAGLAAETAAEVARVLAALSADTASTLARKFAVDGRPEQSQRDRGRANGITRSAQGMREIHAVCRAADFFKAKSGAL